MNGESSKAGRPSRSSLLILTAVVLMAAVGFLLSDPDDIRGSEGATSGTCGDDLTWSVDSYGNLVIEGSGPMRNYDSSSNHPWGDDIRSVVLGDSVTSIGNRAFVGCYSLTSVTIPDSVVSVNDDAFWGCSSLESVVLPDSVTSLGTFVFYNCTSLVSADIGDSVVSIGSSAFSGCSSLTSITVPDSVVSLGDSVFRGCASLESIVLPDSVTVIKTSVFEDCTSLASFTVSDAVTSIGDHAFFGCTSLGSIVLPDSVEDFGMTAFEGCTSLVSADIGGSVTSIAAYSFLGCTSLTSFTVPRQVTSIGGAAFQGCTSLFEVVNLSTLDIVKGSYSYGEIAYNAENVLASEEDGTVRTLDDAFVFGTSGGTDRLVKYIGDGGSVTLPETESGGTYMIHGYAFADRVSVTSVTIPYSVTGIDRYAFSGCTSLRSVSIPDSVSSMGYNAFSGCTSLESFTFPDSMYYINSFVLSGCTSLTSVTIPDSVTRIGWEAFSGCTALKDVTIPDSVMRIGDEAFRYCTSLTSVSIPASVIKIFDGAFAGCTSLTRIDVDDSNTEYRSVDGVLYDKNMTRLLQYPAGKTAASFRVPDTVTAIGSEAFLGCTALKDVTIPDSVDSMGDLTFLGCTSLTSLRIPGPVTSIGYSAFNGCTSLTSVTVPDSLRTISSWAFSGCSSLRSIVIPDSVTYVGVDAFHGCDGLLDIKVGKGVSDYPSGSYYLFPGHVFYDEDGVTRLSQSGSNLAGNTFRGQTVDRMIKMVTHTVTYDIDGGSGTAPADGRYVDGDEFPLPGYDGAKTGYVFAGWSRDGTGYTVGQTVTMSSEDMEFVAVWVVKKDVTSISLSETDTTLVRGEARTLIATVYPTDATMKDVVWTSADGSVAAVDENGKVTALGLGRTTITATSADGGISASCIVSVEDRKILVAIKSAGDGNVYVMISSLDGGHVPAGKITMELNYSVYSATLEDWVDRSDSTKDDPVLVETDGTFVIQLIDLSDAEHPADYTSAVAMFTVGEGEDQTVYVSDITAYSGKSS